MREDWGGDVNGCWVVRGWRAELDIVVNRCTRMCVRRRVSVGPSAPLWYSGVWGSYTHSLAICLSFRARASRRRCMRAPCARVPRLPSIRAPLARVVMCTARLQAVGRAKPGPSHGLTTALARPEILESPSRRLRLRLWYEFFGMWKVPY
jgi:hypothetical protein